MNIKKRIVYRVRYYPRIQVSTGGLGTLIPAGKTTVHHGEGKAHPGTDHEYSRGGVEVELCCGLGARWGSVVNVTPGPLYLRG